LVLCERFRRVDECGLDACLIAFIAVSLVLKNLIENWDEPRFSFPSSRCGCDDGVIALKNGLNTAFLEVVESLEPNFCECTANVGLKLCRSRKVVPRLVTPVWDIECLQIGTTHAREVVFPIDEPVSDAACCPSTTTNEVVVIGLLHLLCTGYWIVHG
jgi:hypothetical protein